MKIQYGFIYRNYDKILNTFIYILESNLQVNSGLNVFKKFLKLCFVWSGLFPLEVLENGFGSVFQIFII